MLIMRVLIAILLAVLVDGIAYSSEHPILKPAEPKNSADTEQRGSDKNPVMVKILPTQDADAKATQEEKYRNEKSIQDEKLADATVLLARVTIAHTVFTGFLWFATYRLAKDSKRTADRQAREMQASLRIAQESADTAKASVTLAREGFISTHCPRLIVRRLIIDYSLESSVIRYEIANIGGTQAKNIEVSAMIWLPDTSHSIPQIGRAHV